MAHVFTDFMSLISWDMYLCMRYSFQVPLDRMWFQWGNVVGNMKLLYTTHACEQLCLWLQFDMSCSRATTNMKVKLGFLYNQNLWLLPCWGLLTSILLYCFYVTCNTWQQSETFQDGHSQWQDKCHFKTNNLIFPNRMIVSPLANYSSVLNCR